MALFSQDRSTAQTGQRLTGFPRYHELLCRDFHRFFFVNLITLFAFIPSISGVLIAILSSSVLILIPSCVIGGMIAGPALSCMYDAIFRSFRDAPGNWFQNYKRAWKQNWRQSVIPGILFCLLLGFYAFMIMIFWWTSRFPGPGTITVFCLGLIFFTMFFSLYWPQIALFEQSQKQRLQNCLLFIMRFFPKTLGCALLQIFYWAVMALFLPWSVLLFPFIGAWFILFTSNFFLYNTINETFGIEEKISEAFPEQTPFYEDDETWLKRKQQENSR